jgi:hypothetical protein
MASAEGAFVTLAFLVYGVEPWYVYVLTFSQP